MWLGRSYPPHPPVGEQLRDASGSIVLLGHAQHLADPLQRQVLRGPREAAPGLGQHPGPAEQPHVQVHDRR